MYFTAIKTFIKQKVEKILIRFNAWLTFKKRKPLLKDTSA